MSREFILAGRYVLRKRRELVLGRGGMGEVYLGQDRETGTPVAIKLLRADKLVDDGGRGNPLLERFKREGEILRDLAHPNIVQMLAVDEIDAQQFLVMEYVPGGSLRDRLAKRELMPIAEVLKIALELADALSRVHHLGIVHRDIKPDNILLMGDGTPRLTDFGVAHLAAGSRVTGAGAVIGTLDYLSPEGCNGLAVDARSDIWSFGVVLYEMLVGRLPFVGETAAMTLAAINSSPTPPIERVGERLPAALVRLVNHMLVKDRDTRQGSARKIAAELESILDTVKRRPLHGSAHPAERVIAPITGETLASTEHQITPRRAQEEPHLSPERQTELRLLEKVHRHWIAGVLEQRDAEPVRLRLLARRCDDVVERPWEHLDVQAERRQPLDISGQLVELFDATDRALLILGEAGGGKSTRLLELTKLLLDRATSNAREPLPVVLSLSSWTKQSGPLDVWIVDELVAKYQLPRRLGRAWLESARLLLLLDELGVGGGGRDHVAAINQFREQHGLTGLVICGRTEDYGRAEGQRLQLGGAIELLPASEVELDRTLRSLEPQLIEILEQDPELREAARSPLMLTLLRSVFTSHAERKDQLTPSDAHSSTTGGGLRRDTGDERPLRERLFASFVGRALRRNPAGRDAELVRDRLSELAVGMSANDQRVFLIEQLQPSWLRSRAHRWVYLALTRVFTVLIISGSLWLVHELLARFGVPQPLSRAHLEGARLLGLPTALGELAALLLLGLIATPALLLVDGLTYEHRARRGSPGTRKFDLPLLGLRMAALFVVFVGLLELVDTWGGAISAVSIVLILNIFMLVQRGSPSFASEIEPVEALGWSWSQAAKWGALAIPLNLGLAVVLWGVDYPVRVVAFVVVTALLFVFVCGGLQQRELDVRSKPNLGTRLSMRNAGIASALVAGAQVPLYCLWWRDPWTVVIGVATAGLVTSLSFGLLAVYQHAVLRMLLAASGQLPLRLQATLDHAVACGLMRRVGGGYMFTYPLLHDYFAGLAKGRTSA